MLISNLTERKRIHYSKIQLVGVRSNRDGLGAQVTLRAANRAWTRYHDGKSGHLGQSSMPLYFGLGEADKIDSVEVLWPSGTKQTLKAPAVDSLLKITETADKAPP